MKAFTRGSLIEFASTFSTIDGSGIQPLTAEVLLSYPANGLAATAVLPLVQDTVVNIWRVRWDSSVCDGGTVDYVVRCHGNIVAAEQGTIQLRANSANIN